MADPGRVVDVVGADDARHLLRDVVHLVRDPPRGQVKRERVGIVGPDPPGDQIERLVPRDAAESTLNIERAAQKQLTQQAKTLEADNMRLKEDLAFFESLLPADTGTRGISIRRVVVDMVAPGQLRYRLLVMQGGKGDVQFDGNVQFSINGQHGGKSVMMLLPDAKSNDADKFKISFKHYQRLEGILAIPEGWIVKTVQARVLEKGQLRTQQSANL